MRAILDAAGSSLQRHVGRFTDTPLSLAMKLPHHHHASSMPPQDAAGAFTLAIGVMNLARIRG